MATMNQAATESTDTSITGKAAEVTPRMVDQWLRAGEVVLVDVREPDEHGREWIAGAKLVPLSKFDARTAAEGRKPGQRLVFHCRGGKRAADACRMAASVLGSGVSVSNMAGGIEAWKTNGLAIEQAQSGAGMISVLRQVQLVIGMLLLIGSALAWFVHPGFLVVPAFLGAGLTFAGASGTCMLASLLGVMPWNKIRGTCESGTCG